MAINFKSTGAIIVYSIATLGILAIIGYNFWGWFGGSDYYTSNNPNAGGTGGGATGSTGATGGSGRIANTEQSLAGGRNVSQPSSERKAVNTIPKHKSMDFHGASNYNGQKVLQLVGYQASIFSVGENVKVDFKSSFNANGLCNQTKLFNGVTYTLLNVVDYQGTYFALYGDGKGNYQKPSITKQEYDTYVSKCFSIKTINAKVVSLINPPQNSLVVINSPFEHQYEMADGRIYN